ncbi:MAG: disulfide bond formation protein B [Janthinobacterium lividum]
MSIYTTFFSSGDNNHKIYYYKLLVAISAVALAGAYYVEFALDLPPCVLCLYQRYCYFALIIFSLLTLIKKIDNKYIFRLLILTLLLACGISGYHSGVERGLFKANSHCSSQVTMTDNLSVSEIKDMLYDKPVASCQRAALKILELSMSEWNFLINLLLIIMLVTMLPPQRRHDAKT